MLSSDAYMSVFGIMFDVIGRYNNVYDAPLRVFENQTTNRYGWLLI